MDAAQATLDAGKRRGKRDPAQGPTQERAIHTRQELLKEARSIFARDGFEAASLQHIAEAAGKTRGALYAHFKDKEDLFFALIAQDMDVDSEVYRRRLRPNSSREEKIAVLTEQLEALIHDRQRAMLYVEFKLYASRRPHKQQRLAELHVAMCYHGSTAKVELIPELAIEDDAERRRVVASFGAVLDGLALNRYFDPVGLTDQEIHDRIEHAVRRRFDAESAGTEALPLEALLVTA